MSISSGTGQFPGEEQTVKIDRLIAIINYLLRHGRTSAQKLAEEFEVSPRTIVRDMETLGQAGIPIQSVCGADGGYSIMDTYIMDRKTISRKDYDHIAAALRALLSAYADKGVEQTMDKVLPLYVRACAEEARCQSGETAPHDSRGGAMSQTAGSRGGEYPVLLDFGVANENREVNAAIQTLERAIRQQRTVTFWYTNNENVRKQMEVEPVRLEFKWYNWYLVAFHPKHQDYCMFKLVRMEEIAVLEKGNAVSHEGRGVVLDDNRTMIAVTLRANPSVRAKCREYLNGEVIRVYPNGDFEFRFYAPENEFYWYGVLLSLGNNITILEPQSVIDRILATCDEVSRHYGKNGGD